MKQSQWWKLQANLQKNYVIAQTHKALQLHCILVIQIVFSLQVPGTFRNALSLRKRRGINERDTLPYLMVISQLFLVGSRMQMTIWTSPGLTLPTLLTVKWSYPHGCGSFKWFWRWRSYWWCEVDTPSSLQTFEGHSRIITFPSQILYLWPFFFWWWIVQIATQLSQSNYNETQNNI